MEKLTIIIPFLNEGNEIENTVVSIRETAITDPYILLLNDCSEDGFDYESVALKYNCRYVKNKIRTGSAPSRDIGVALCETPYFLFLDGHMRFYEQGWDEKLIRLLTENPRSLLCSQTKRLTRNEENLVILDTEEKRKSFGAYLSMEKAAMFLAKWNVVELTPHSELMEIPLVLGAAYACNKNYWEYLSGLKGLICYGLEEQMISIKVWLEGGQCLLVKDWVVGHIYRKSFPYEVPKVETFYNRLFLLELLFPYSIKNDYFAEYQMVNSSFFSKAYTILKKNYKEVKAQKNYLSTVLKYKIDYFLEINDRIKMLN